MVGLEAEQGQKQLSELHSIQLDSRVDLIWELQTFGGLLCRRLMSFSALDLVLKTPDLQLHLINLFPSCGQIQVQFYFLRFQVDQFLLSFPQCLSLQIGFHLCLSQREPHLSHLFLGISLGCLQSLKLFVVFGLQSRDPLF